MLPRQIVLRNERVENVLDCRNREGIHYVTLAEDK